MTENGKPFETQALELAAAAGLGGTCRLEAVPGGRNNKAFLLCAASDEAFVKAYFRHPADPRDRLGAETAFLAHAARLGVTAVPRLLGADPQAGLALLGYVRGRKMRPDELAWEHVAAAAAFYQAVNAAPAALAPASEACFSLPQHLHCVTRRIGRLVNEAAAGCMRPDAAAFVRDELAPAWDAARARILEAAPVRLGQAWEAELPEADRRVSPSDFGFHNALLTEDGGVVFLDFEYAGLDDPAKMVCDFFCQPEIPVPLSMLPPFLERVRSVSPDDASLPARVDLLLPAYRLKWCCIMLNDFLPVGDARRCFAACEETDGRCDRQLALVREKLKQHAALTRE